MRAHARIPYFMSESFADLFEQSLNTIEMAPGSIVTGTVVDIDNDWVIVHAGLKSEGVIPRNQFLNEAGEFSLNIGDQVKVAMEVVDDGFGETRLSREKAKRAESWQMLDAAFAENEVVKGIINGKVKGGFTVDISDIRAFLPGSLVDIRPLRETTHLEGRPLEFKVIKLDQKRNNVVVSRRAVLEAENSVEREALLNSLQEGQSMKGIVKNLTDYGAFVDLGGVDGLLHITDMAWRRIRHPSEMVNVGDEVEVKILKFDREKNRVSLGMKQLGRRSVGRDHPPLPGRPRVQANVHQPHRLRLLCRDRRGRGRPGPRLRDGLDQQEHPSIEGGCRGRPGGGDGARHRRGAPPHLAGYQAVPHQPLGRVQRAQQAKGDRISGKIKSITDFGIFIGLDGGIDGLVHLSDISWNEPGETAVRRYSKGEEIETTILSIDPDRERISLGVKQLDGDPWSDYVNANERNTIVPATVIAVEPREATVRLSADVEATLRASEIKIDRVEDARAELSEGQEIEVKIIGIDRKNRGISVSIKAKDEAEERAAVEEHRANEPERAATTLGDLIKAQMDQQDS